MASPLPRGPLHAVRFGLEPDVSVLYGVNGAGKSTLLRGVALALSGFARDGYQAILHIQVHPVDSIELSYGTLETRDTLLQALAKSLETLPQRPLGPHGREDTVGSIGTTITPGEFVRRTADRLLERWDVLAQFPWSPQEDSLDSLRAGSRVERVAAEIAAQGLFNLRAVGTASPAWEVWVAARADESTLSFSRSLRELYECIEAVFEAEEAMECAESDEGADEASEALSELQQLREDIDLPTEVRYWSDDAYMTSEDLMRGHPWAGSRVALCGVIQPTPFLTVISESAFEPGPATLARVRTSTLSLFSCDQAGQPAFSGEARSWMAGISAEASDIAAGLLLDAPELRCSALPVAEWPDGAFVRWEAFDWPSERWVALGDLS